LRIQQVKHDHAHLAGIGGTELGAAVIGALAEVARSDSDDFVRSNAAQALGQLG